MMVNVIVENVSKNYGEKTALKPFSCVFKAGRVNALIGPSGSGKSTLIRLILGLEATSTGRIHFTDENGSSVKPAISVTFQENRLVPSLTVGANLHMVEPKDAPFSDEMLAKNFEIFNLPPQVSKQRASELSGGMARRISLLRSLLVPFDVLILDEPFKGLDLQTKEMVVKSLTFLWRGKTVILVTHDLSELHDLDANIVSLV